MTATADQGHVLLRMDLNAALEPVGRQQAASGYHAALSGIPDDIPADIHVVETAGILAQQFMAAVLSQMTVRTTSCKQGKNMTGASRAVSLPDHLNRFSTASSAVIRKRISCPFMLAMPTPTAGLHC